MYSTPNPISNPDPTFAQKKLASTLEKMCRLDYMHYRANKLKVDDLFMACCVWSQNLSDECAATLDARIILESLSYLRE